MDLLIGADFVPTNSNSVLFESGDIQTLFGLELIDLCKNATFRIFNLEMPLCDNADPINKCGPNLMGSKNTIHAYEKLNVTAVTLANNHITDQGNQGLQDTMSLLNKHGIDFFGAGNNLSEARRPYIIAVNNKRVGIYACVEHEFSVATDSLPGACPFDPLYSLDEISKLRELCDYVIVLYHGGKEHYRYPSPQLQKKTCRRMVEKGANVVLCQHSHCVGCEEKYENGIIVYGQGNFLFDDSSEECWQTGLLVGVDIGEKIHCSYFPVKKVGNKVRLAKEKEKDDILTQFNARSNLIKNPEFVITKYNEFSDALLDHYLIAFSGKRSMLNRILNRLSGYRFSKFAVRRKYDRKAMTVIRNFVECEAHREVSLNALIRATEEKKSDC